MNEMAITYLAILNAISRWVIALGDGDDDVKLISCGQVQTHPDVSDFPRLKFDIVFWGGSQLGDRWSFFGGRALLRRRNSKLRAVSQPPGVAPPACCT
jgi:hypothetical protein